MFSKKRRQRKRYGLPKVIKDNWFARVVHMEEEKYPLAFDENDKFIDYKKGDVVPMQETGDGKLAYYEIVDIHYRHGDWLYASDGYNYDLEFHHVA